MAIKTSNQITITEHKKIIEIREWYLATPQDSGITRDTDGWTTTVQTINETNKYLWNYEEVIYSLGDSEPSDPIVIGVYSNGIDWKGILSIKNYYYVTQEPELPDNFEWLEKVPLLSSTNKYLWNYEIITYTDGSTDETEPAIIGAYGDSGTGSIDFQIYSIDGFEFSDSLTSIELKTIAFKNGDEIKSGATYQWKWWNSESDLEDKYEVISEATESTLIVDVDDIFAFASLKCEMIYDDVTYEDYVSLTKQTVVYTAIAKFFDGNNIIASDEDHLIIYVELYKDNEPEELLHGDSVYNSDANIVQDNIIITDLDGEYEDGDIMYFVCKNTYDNTVEYDVAFGQYTSGQWQTVQNNYIYKNDLFANTISPIVFVPKEKISRSLNINFEIRDNNSTLARTSAMVLDFNDPTISSTAPLNPKEGQLWLDTSVSPSILKMWDGLEWVNSGYQNGNVIYTSKPEDGYSKGDLWILSEEDAELFEDFGPGSMLKAIATSNTFDETHWIDADAEATELKNNIKQYFLFNPDTGLRIGQSDNKFYVNISSTRMSFCENPLVSSSDEEEVIDPNEVVSISNRSATIRNLTVEDGAVFNCEVRFGNFILKTESNGSLSLALAT